MVARVAHSCAVNARSVSPISSNRFPACRAASGIGGVVREASTRWTCAGSRRTSPPSTAAADDRALSRCTSSRTRHSGTGAAESSSRTRSVSGSADRRAAPRAMKTADTNVSASSSPGSIPTQACTPGGRSSSARYACASTVDLPKPAPATTSVTGTLQRRASLATRAGRSTSTADRYGTDPRERSIAVSPRVPPDLRESGRAGGDRAPPPRLAHVPLPTAGDPPSRRLVRPRPTRGLRIGSRRRTGEPPGP